jgi:hypothetical protein
MSVPLADVMAALEKVQASPLPRVWARVKPGELTLLRALADAVRRAQAEGGNGRHSGGVAQVLAALDLSQDTG